ncbi:MAG: MaoC family dehydratase [Firmicutes bacterium]|nr:MaoC family dehydratase [Bacillota bacterium]
MSKSIHEISIGDYETFTKKFTEDDTEKYANLTQDFNPAHMDEDYASKTMFKKRIVHGMLVSSMFSTIFGMKFPGVGSIYTKQSLKFKKPVYFGDEITAKVTVSEIIIERNRVIFECVSINQLGETVIEGQAEIMPPRE